MSAPEEIAAAWERVATLEAWVTRLRRALAEAILAAETLEESERYRNENPQN